MPDRCIIYGCSNENTQAGVTLFSFPKRTKDENRFLKWIKFVKHTRGNWDITHSSKICSEHFNEESFELNFKLMETFGLYCRRALIPDAVPTIYPKVVQSNKRGKKLLNCTCVKETDRKLPVPSSKCQKEKQKRRNIGPKVPAVPCWSKKVKQEWQCDVHDEGLQNQATDIAMKSSSDGLNAASSTGHKQTRTDESEQTPERHSSDSCSQNCEKKRRSRKNNRRQTKPNPNKKRKVQDLRTESVKTRSKVSQRKTPANCACQTSGDIRHTPIFETLAMHVQASENSDDTYLSKCFEAQYVDELGQYKVLYREPRQDRLEMQACGDNIRFTSERIITEVPPVIKKEPQDDLEKQGYWHTVTAEKCRLDSIKVEPRDDFESTQVHQNNLENKNRQSCSYSNNEMESLCNLEMQVYQDSCCQTSKKIITDKSEVGRKTESLKKESQVSVMIPVHQDSCKQIPEKSSLDKSMVSDIEIELPNNWEIMFEYPGNESHPPL